MKNISVLRKWLMVIIASLLLANVVSVSTINILSQFVNPPELLSALEKLNNNQIIFLLSQVLPFPLVVAILFWYYKPIWSNIELPQQLIPPFVLRRIVNMPLQLASVGTLGWIVGYVIFLSFSLIIGVNPGLKFTILNFAQTFVLASITFVITFYFTEEICRKKIIPRLFIGNELVELSGVFRTLIRNKFIILWFSIFALPVLVLYLLTMNLNNNGINAYNKDLMNSVNYLFAVFTVTAFIIVLQVSRSLTKPIYALKNMTDQVSGGNYESSVTVVSADEIGSLGASFNNMTEGLREKETIKDTFGKVVDPQVRDFLLQGELKLGGEECIATILFSDLQGFTGLSEGRTPEEVVRILNRYFSTMTECILRERGIVNKYVGDAIMAVFGLPIAFYDHAGAATRAAQEMFSAQKLLNAELSAEGFPSLTTRIGIHTGKVLAGNIGSQTRMEYTVIGDSVNIASRLESTCKKLQKKILISGDSYRVMEQKSGLEYLGKVKLKGKTELTEVYTFR